MSRRLEPLWRALREYADPRDTEAGWRERLGPGWDAGRPLFRLTRDRAVTWPCGIEGSLGCSRRIVDHSGGELVAVCGDRHPRCGRLRLAAPALGLWRVDLRVVAAAACARLGEGPVVEREGDVTLGPLMVGGCSVALAVTGTSSVLGLLEAAERLGAVAPGSKRLVLAPLGRHLGAMERHALERTGCEVMSLQQCVAVRQGQVIFDLSGWALRHREDLGGADPAQLLGDRYDLILDPRRERVWLWGTLVDLRRRQRPRWLLEGLASRAGQVVTRDELFDEVWPDKAPSEVEAWEVNLRSTKADLVRRMRAALSGRKSPIESVSGSAVDGGYRLTIEADRIAWWSDRLEG